MELQKGNTSEDIKKLFKLFIISRATGYGFVQLK